MVHFQQYYKSNHIDDLGQKTLFLKKDKNYDWKIIHETWSKDKENNSIAFTPALRFFQEESEVAKN